MIGVKRGMKLRMRNCEISVSAGYKTGIHFRTQDGKHVFSEKMIMVIVFKVSVLYNARAIADNSNSRFGSETH